MLRCIQKSEENHNWQTSDITLALNTNINVVSTETVLVVYEPARPTQVRVKQKITKEEVTENLVKLMALPPDLETIQPHPSQCWNCDEVGINPNGNWRKSSAHTHGVHPTKFGRYKQGNNHHSGAHPFFSHTQTGNVSSHLLSYINLL